MVAEILRIALVVISVVSAIDLVRVASRRSQLGVNLESVALGAITNFFDALGIGFYSGHAERGP